MMQGTQGTQKVFIMNRYFSSTISEKARKYRALYMKRYREEHREALNDYQRKYRKEHPEKLKEYNRRYAAKHEEELRERRKRYAEAYWERKAIHENHEESGSAGGALDYIDAEGSSGESWDQLPNAQHILSRSGLPETV